MKYINFLILTIISGIFLLNSSCYSKEGIPFKEGQVWTGTYYFPPSTPYRDHKFNLIISKVNGKKVDALVYNYAMEEKKNNIKDYSPYVSFNLYTLTGEFKNTNKSIVFKPNRFFIYAKDVFESDRIFDGSFAPDNNTYAGEAYSENYPMTRQTFSVKLSGTLEDFPQLERTIKNAIDHFDYSKHRAINYAKEKINRWNNIKSTQQEVIQILKKYPIKPELEKCINEKISTEGIYLSYFDVDKCRTEFNRKLEIIRTHRDDLDELYKFQSLVDTDLVSEVLESINNSDINEDDQKIKTIISDTLNITRNKLQELASDKKALFLGLDISKQLSKADVKKAFEKHGAILKESTKRTDVYNFGETGSLKNVKAVCFFTEKKLLRKQELVEITLSYPEYQVVLSFQQNIESFALTQEQFDKRNAELKSRLDRRHSVFNGLIDNYGSYHKKMIIDNQSLDTPKEDLEILKNAFVIISGLGKARYNYRYGYTPYRHGDIGKGAAGYFEAAKEKAKKTKNIAIFQWIVDHGKSAIIFLNTWQPDESLAKASPECFYTVTYRNIEAFNKSKNTTEN